MRARILLIALPLALAACGSDSKTSATTTTAASRSETFVEAGNQVCIRSDKRIYAIGRLTRDAKGWKRTADSAKRAMREMRTVKPPAARADAFDEMLRYGNALTLSIQEVYHSLAKKDYDTAAAAQLAAGQLQDRVHAAAKDAGLTFCQQALTNWPA